ncbi:cyanoexosortase A [Nostoc sphaeroides CHAB 2801]|uniref:cyanoexosortase A n=1 Tax=Nostoc sphaeroides TaxID=446679 RepID=UPI000E4CC1E6|nr:cyanoexosortase A [Nostoc sphaeroides]MCC5629103.1 cyanoexosortase A [Nostoc sphaeroides CHAB 2801]
MIKIYSIAKSLKNAEFWLLGIGSSLIAINLTTVLRHEKFTSAYISFLFFLTIYFLVQEKRHNLNLESEIFSSCLGTLVIVLVFINSTFQINIGILSILPPLMSGFGVALLASGYQGLKQYRKELLILVFLTIRSFLVLLPYQIDISLLAAKLSTALLWYTGFQVNRSGVMINLPTGSIEVYPGCAGIDIIIDLLSLAVLFIFLFNLSLQQKIIVPIVAATLGFIVNGFRVALMAIFVAQGNKQAFYYWHQGDGSLIFSMIATLFFGCFCWFLLSRNERENQNTTDYSR